jgi:hypothetical protein
MMPPNHFRFLLDEAKSCRPRSTFSRVSGGSQRIAKEGSK